MNNNIFPIFLIIILMNNNIFSIFFIIILILIFSGDKINWKIYIKENYDTISNNNNNNNSQTTPNNINDLINLKINIPPENITKIESENTNTNNNYNYLILITVVVILILFMCCICCIFTPSSQIQSKSYNTNNNLQGISDTSNYNTYHVPISIPLPIQNQIQPIIIPYNFGLYTLNQIPNQIPNQILNY